MSEGKCSTGSHSCALSLTGRGDVAMGQEASTVLSAEEKPGGNGILNERLKELDFFGIFFCMKLSVLL